MKKEIYVYLLDEGIDTWRPVEAEHIEGDRYEIISENNDETEKWQFSKGDHVICNETVFEDGTKGLVAIQKVE